MKKLVRNGSVIKLVREGSSDRFGEYPYQETIWKVDLYLFLYIPFILTIAAFLVFLYEKRYEACMRIFNDLWYCALR